LNALVEVGLERLTGRLPAYFNVSPGLLRDPSIGLLPPRRVVIELLETHVPDAATLNAVQNLRNAGYRIALDDFTFADNQMPFLEYVDLVKVDVLDTPWYKIAQGMPMLKRLGATLLAEKVEDPKMHARCLRAGFSLFQGYFFARPETLESRSLPPSRLALMRVLAEVYRPEPRPADVEMAIASDPGLALRILRMVNSAAMALPSRVDSVRTAIALLGVRRIQALAVLLAAQARTTPMPVLANMAMVRARVCEELARQSQRCEPAVHFTLGLLSVLDGLLDMPMPLIVSHLSLDPDLAAALIDPHGDSPLAWSLQAVLLYERADWTGLEERGLDAAHISAVAANAYNSPTFVTDVAA
jgi:EAL and modified HD-GYP domain-containing signal transduction protein